MKGKTKDIALVAVFTAVMIICSQISINIPISPVPITLSIFAVLSTVLLGFKKGTLVQVVYVTLGICGAPVFNGFSGALQGFRPHRRIYCLIHNYGFGDGIFD